jgi:hypothetical protein
MSDRDQTDALNRGIRRAAGREVVEEDPPDAVHAAWSKQMEKAKSDDDAELVSMLREVEPTRPRRASTDAGAGGSGNAPPESFSDYIRRAAGYR